MTQASMHNFDNIRNRIDAELAMITDPARRDILKSILVPPKLLSLKWGYGKPGEHFKCWIVGLSPNGKERLVYCEQGFGPNYSWGYVGVDEDWIGMDCQWHTSLEHAAIGIQILPAPPNYEVP